MNVNEGNMYGDEWNQEISSRAFFQNYQNCKIISQLINKYTCRLHFYILGEKLCLEAWAFNAVYGIEKFRNKRFDSNSEIINSRQNQEVVLHKSYQKYTYLALACERRPISGCRLSPPAKTSDSRKQVCVRRLIQPSTNKISHSVHDTIFLRER